MQVYENALVSIVVPMYNCEAYIARLLQSLLVQTYSRFEVICVDDGSTDKTAEIVEAFCAQDARIRLVSQDNSGAGSARNAGMDEARGDYVVFLDADDAYDAELLATMQAALQEHDADIAICMFTLIDDVLGRELPKRGLYGPFAASEAAFAPGEVDDLFMLTSPNPVNKMYRLDFLRRLGLRYTAGKIAQDLTFTYSALPLARRIAVVPKSLATVHTGADTESITSGRAKYPLDALYALRELYAWLCAHGIEKDFEPTFLNRCENAIIYETNFSYNEDYLRDVAHFLTREAPWSRMPLKRTKELMRVHPEKLGAHIARLEDEIAAQGSNPARERQREAAGNRLQSLRRLDSLLDETAPQVSIIVPLYNCEDFVDGFLDCMRAQTFTDYELICIDDGSTDETLSKLRARSKTDARVKVVRVEHGGAGAARNSGLDVASGKYLAFYDVDDLYSEDVLQELYAQAEAHQADEVFCLYEELDCRNGTRTAGIGFREGAFPNGALVAAGDLDDLFRQIGCRLSNVLFRRELVDSYGIRFPTTHTANDLFFRYACACCARNFVGVHKQLLTVRTYVNHHNSITSSRWRYTHEVVAIYEHLYEWLEESDVLAGRERDYRNLFGDCIWYNASFPYNERFAQAFARSISTHRAWAGISDEVLYRDHWKRFSSLQAAIEEKHKSGAYEQAQKLSNTLLSIRRIEEIAWTAYGRVLNPTSAAAALAAQEDSRRKLEEEHEGARKKIALLNGNLEATRARNDELRKSNSWRVGRAVTWVPRKARSFARKMKRRRQNPEKI